MNSELFIFICKVNFQLIYFFDIESQFVWPGKAQLGREYCEGGAPGFWLVYNRKCA
jgi:hypothetical protein